MFFQQICFPLPFFAISPSCRNRRIDALYIANKETGHGNDFSFVRWGGKKKRTLEQTCRMKRDKNAY